MEFGFCPLASGSKGNAHLLCSAERKILIDAGLSMKACTERLASLGVHPSELDGILVSHEHSDHIQGVGALCNKYKLPVLANAETAKEILKKCSKEPRFLIFSTGESFEFGDIEIRPFSTQHDAVDPVMFTFHFAGIKLGVCTDLGFASTLVRQHLRDCDYLLLEANHRPSMVHACPRPMNYKQRVLGRSGHLSNEDAAALLCEIAHPGLKHVYLAHLSEECNSHEAALETVRTALTEKGIDLSLSIAYQKKVSLALEFDEASRVLS